MNCLYVFIDESGNFDFSQNGTNHLVLGSYSTFNPIEGLSEMVSLKYELLLNGYEQEYFHATEDFQNVRNQVFEIIKNKISGDYDFISIKKNKVNPKNRNSKDVYNVLAQSLLQRILKRYNGKFELVVVVIDRALSKKETGYLKQIIKSELKKYNVKFNLLFFRTISDCNSQLADYGSWSKFVSVERGEFRPKNEITKLIKTDLDIFTDGGVDYY